MPWRPSPISSSCPPLSRVFEHRQRDGRKSQAPFRRTKREPGTHPRDFWRHTGRAVLDIVPRVLSPIDWRSEQCLGGQPRPTAPRCTCSRNEGGRRRAIGGVAVLPVSLARSSRWCDAREPPIRKRLRRPALRDAMVPISLSKQRQPTGTAISGRASSSQQGQPSATAVYPGGDQPLPYEDIPEQIRSGPLFGLHPLKSASPRSLTPHRSRLPHSLLRWLCAFAPLRKGCDVCDEIRVHPRNPRPICDGATLGSLPPGGDSEGRCSR